MLFWIIPVICAIIAFCFMFIIMDEDFGSSLWIALLGAIVGLLIIVLSWGIITMVADTEWVEESTIPIVALTDKVEVEGKFYMRRGYIDNSLEYYFIEDTEYGLKANHISAYGAYIKYTDEQPCKVTYKEVYSNDFIKWAFSDDALNHSYVFYLPEGSVLTETYEIDLE